MLYEVFIVDLIFSHVSIFYEENLLGTFFFQKSRRNTRHRTNEFHPLMND